MLSRTCRFAFLILVLASSIAQGQFLNNQGYDNGASLDYLTLSLLGVSQASVVPAPTGITPIPPSDVPDHEDFDTTYWNGDLRSGANYSTTVLGELHEIRFQLVEFRRFMVIALGMFFGLEVLKIIFRNV